MDIDIGRHALDTVNQLRQECGRWPLQTDSQLSHWAWEHIQWMMREGGFRHPPNGELHFQVENLFQGGCQNPYSLASHFIRHGDGNHMHNFLREDVRAQGVAVYTSEYFDRYQMILAWRALRN